MLNNRGDNCVTESQYKLITESEKYIKVFQGLIENELKYIRRVCDMGADDFQGDVGGRAARQD